MVYGALWCMIYGVLQCMVHGEWCTMVHDSQCTIVIGVWCTMVYGAPWWAGGWGGQGVTTATKYLLVTRFYSAAFFYWKSLK